MLDFNFRNLSIISHVLLLEGWNLLYALSKVTKTFYYNHSKKKRKKQKCEWQNPRGKNIIMRYTVVVEVQKVLDRAL